VAGFVGPSNPQAHSAQTYVLVKELVVVGYYSVAASSVSHDKPRSAMRPALNVPAQFGILVRMTRLNTPRKSRKTTAPKSPPGHWVLQDAKARFSELVRKVRSEGPQHVTVHGRDEVVVIAAEEFRRLKGEKSGQALIEALQASPHREIDIAPERHIMPVRSVAL
jgi:prevent-host-death family protein